MLVHVFGNSHVWTLFGLYGGPNDTRMQTVLDDGTVLWGWKLGSTGATAWGLANPNSQTGAGSAIVRILDADPTPAKTVLMVFGEVDVSGFIGPNRPAELAVGRYAGYLHGIQSRPDVRQVIVASVVPHSRTFHGDQHDRIVANCDDWNIHLMLECRTRGLTYLDWYTPLDLADGEADGNVPDFLEHNANDPGECHLSPDARPILAAALRASLLP